MDAQWLDDLHHALHAVLTGERAGYYADYGSVEHLARCYRHAFAYAGEFSEYHARSHGAPAPDARPAQFVVCSQNHDQIGNRLGGERLTALVDLESLKLAAAAAILSPFTPLLFMGEEYAEPAPFPYFVSHSDPSLIEAVRKGRRAEFAAFAWAGEPPDPQAASTYASARLNPALRERSPHAELYAYYRELIALRRELPRHGRVDAPTLDVRVLPPDGRVVALLRRSAERRALVVLNFDTERVTIAFDELRGVWRRRLDSAAERWAGSGSRLPERFGEHEGSARFAMPPRAAAVFTSECAAQ
jgi:maltooligosyltrehalose trehalohydrolase